MITDLLDVVYSDVVLRGKLCGKVDYAHQNLREVVTQLADSLDSITNARDRSLTKWT